jgi:hypothetical protein
MKLRFREWLAPIVIALVAVPSLAYCVAKTSDGTPQPLPVVATVALPTPKPYEPISVNPIVFLTPPPFQSGQIVTVRDGICNNTNDVLQGITIVGFEEQEKDRLSTRNIILQPQTDPGTAATSPLPRPISPGCLGTDPVTAPLCAVFSATDLHSCLTPLPPGKWKLYINLTVMGPQASQVQRINDVSQTFEVLPP